MAMRYCQQIPWHEKNKMHRYQNHGVMLCVVKGMSQAFVVVIKFAQYFLIRVFSAACNPAWLYLIKFKLIFFFVTYLLRDCFS